MMPPLNMMFMFPDIPSTQSWIFWTPKRTYGNSPFRIILTLSNVFDKNVNLSSVHILLTYQNKRQSGISQSLKFWTNIMRERCGKFFARNTFSLETNNANREIDESNTSARALCIINNFQPIKFRFAIIFDYHLVVLAPRQHIFASTFIKYYIITIISPGTHNCLKTIFMNFFILSVADSFCEIRNGL